MFGDFGELRSLKPVSLSSDSDYLAMLNRADEVQTFRQMRPQVGEPIRFGLKNDYANLAAGEILLILEAFVHRQKDLESRILRQRE
jgi:hypothetical protein